MGLIVPSGFCSETNTDSQERHTATIRDTDSDLLITCEKDAEGYHHCSKVFWLCESDTRENGRFTAHNPTDDEPTETERPDLQLSNRLKSEETGVDTPDFRSRVGRFLDDDDRFTVDHRLLVRRLDRRVESVAGVAEHLDDLAVGGDGLADFDGRVELEVL